MIRNNLTNKIVSGILHCPDVEKNVIWPKVKKHSKKFKNSSELGIITWNNLSEGCFEKSCRDSGLFVSIYGGEIPIWNNYLKFKFNVEAALTLGYPYIMGCDSHDVILIGEPSLILEMFKLHNCKLLFNAEKQFYPNLNEPIVQRWKSFQESVYKNGFRYLNAGVWIGETKFVIDFFNYCSTIFSYDLFDCSSYPTLKKESIGCDQSSVHYAFEKFYPNVQIDEDADLFLNLANLKQDDISFVHKFL